MQKWQIGDVTVTKIVEMETCGGASWILPDATLELCREISWLKPDFMDDAGELKFSVHALVIETGSKTIVVDTCVGNEKQRMPYRDWHLLQTAFLEDFANAGFDTSTVDCVLCTHLHVDHVGWNTMLVDDECSVEAVAGTLGMNHNQVYKAKSRVLRELRAILAELDA